MACRPVDARIGRMSSSFTRPGAVDLSALAAKAKKSAEAATRAPGGAVGGGAGAAVVIDVSEADFQAKVIDQSMTVPVVVDFWADWCQPCKTLSPILAKVATEYAGRFLVAKVDIEANQQLAAAAGVQSIPLVIAVVRGQVVPMFNGALPEAQVRQVIDELLKVAAENGVTGRLDLAPEGEVGEEEPAEPAADPRYEAAETALAEGDFATARAEFQKLLAAAPGDAVARQGVVNADVLERSLGADEPTLQAKAAADPGDVDTAIALADVEITGGQTGAAFRRLIACVQATSGPERERARTHLVELFDLVGPADPDVTTARRQLASALF
jgi:putative thioredoxin